MKLQSWILMTLMDGEKKKLGDLMPFLLSKVDPATAVKKYAGAWKLSKNPGKAKGIPSLEKQITLGKRRVLVTAVQALIAGRKRNNQPPFLTAEKPTEGAHARGQAGPAENWILQLTPEGKKALFIKHRRGCNTGSPVWTALRMAHKAGHVKIDLEFTLDHSEFIREE